MKKSWLVIVLVAVVCIAIAIFLVISIHAHYRHETIVDSSQNLVSISSGSSITIPNTLGGQAALQQDGHLTILDITTSNGLVQHIPLSHPSDYLQGSDSPYAAKLVAEDLDHYLIFTDTFASNPGNPQGECGASQTGERFLHVVALGALPHETLAVLIESCLLGVEPTATTPIWTPSTYSGGYIGEIKIQFEPSTKMPGVIYYVGPDGSVSRPQSQP